MTSRASVDGVRRNRTAQRSVRNKPWRGRPNSRVTRGHLGPSEGFFSVNTEDFESAPLFAYRKTRRKMRRFCVRLLQHGSPTESRGCVRIAKLATFATHGFWGRFGRFHIPNGPL